MENKVVIEGVADSTVKTPFLHSVNSQPRVETRITHVNTVTGGRHRFMVQLRGTLAINFFEKYVPGTQYRFTARLKIGSQGRVKIVAYEYEAVQDGVKLEEEALSAFLAEKQSKLQALENRIAEQSRTAALMAQVAADDSDDDSDYSDEE